MSLAPQRLEAIRDLLERRFGLALPAVGVEQVANAVERALAAAPEADEEECGRILDELPIDESWLFRDEGLWKWLLEEEGPALLDLAFARGRPLRVLSLGCSHGEEAFSAAIVFQKLLEGFGISGAQAHQYVRVDGVDASPRRIALARGGMLANWSVERSPREPWMRRRLARVAGDRDAWRVDPTVCEMCRFEVGNLCELAAPEGPLLCGYDLVLCRHVLIYFEAEAARSLVVELSRKLSSGAVLVVAATEAHLLAELPHLEPLPHLGAGRGRVARREPAQPRPDLSVRSSARPAPAPRIMPFVPLAVSLPEPEAQPDPENLVQRMLQGEELMRRDAARGRTLLQSLLSELSVLPADRAFAADLSVLQLSKAIKSLLDRGERG